MIAFDNRKQNSTLHFAVMEQFPRYKFISSALPGVVLSVFFVQIACIQLNPTWKDLWWGKYSFREYSL